MPADIDETRATALQPGVEPAPMQAGAWQPDVTRYVTPDSPADQRARPHALTDDDLAKIRAPYARTYGAQRDVQQVIKAAKAGDLRRLTELVPDAPGNEFDSFKQAVLDAMAAKAEAAAVERATRIASSAAAHALTEQELAKIPAPRLQGQQADQIEGIKDAATVGNDAHVKGVLPEDFDNEVDRFKQAVLRAMAAKSTQVYADQLQQLQTQQATTARARVRP
jgi:hypothetical protein